MRHLSLSLQLLFMAFAAQAQCEAMPPEQRAKRHHAETYPSPYDILRSEIGLPPYGYHSDTLAPKASLLFDLVHREYPIGLSHEVIDSERLVVQRFIHRTEAGVTVFEQFRWHHGLVLYFKDGIATVEKRLCTFLKEHKGK